MLIPESRESPVAGASLYLSFLQVHRQPILVIQIARRQSPCCSFTHPVGHLLATLLSHGRGGFALLSFNASSIRDIDTPYTYNLTGCGPSDAASHHERSRHDPTPAEFP